MTTDARRSPDSRSYFLYFFALIAISLTSGLVYGWPALRRNLLNHGNSTLSEKDLGVIFTCGAWSTQGGRLFIGLVRDKYGTKITACLSLFVLAMGCLGIAFSGSDNTIALGASMVLVGVGSGGQLCMQPVAGLFQCSGAILTSLSGAFQVSGFIFAGLFLTTTDRSLAFGAYCGVCLVLCATAAFVLPKGASFQKNTMGDAHPEEVKEAEERKLEAGSTKSNRIKLQPVELPNLEEREREVDSPKVLDNLEEGTEKVYSEEAKDAKEKELEVESTKSKNIDWPKAVDDLEEGVKFSSCQKGVTERAYSEETQEGKEKELEGGSTSKNIELQSIELPNLKVKERKANSPKVAENLEKGAELSKNNDEELGDSEITISEPQSVKTMMRSYEYISLLLWFSVCVIVLQYYIGSIGFQLEQKGDTDGNYALLFSIFYSGAALLSPFVGYIADFAGLGVAQGLATSLTAASMFILASDSIPLSRGQSIGMIFYGLGRMMTWGNFFSNVGKRFGYENFGTLAGFGLIFSAMASLLQYPLIAATADGHGKTVNILCGIATVVMLPYCYWLSSLEKKG